MLNGTIGKILEVLFSAFRRSEVAINGPDIALSPPPEPSLGAARNFAYSRGQIERRRKRA
jgi:hypothetical protein